MKQIRMSEKNWRRVFLLACIAFFSIAYKCTAQDQPMKFNHPDEVMYVGVNDGRIFAYFQCDSTTNYVLSIGYQNGTFEYLKGDTKGKMRIYPLHADATRRLSKEPFNVVYFESQDKKFICSEIKTKDYFIKHLK